MDSNNRYKSDQRNSTFGLHAVVSQFMEDLGSEGFENLLWNPTLSDSVLVSENTVWPGWTNDLSDLELELASRRFLLTKTSSGANEYLSQDITSALEPGKVYTLIFDGIVENDLVIQVVGSAFDLINLQHQETGSATENVVGLTDPVRKIIRFRMASVLSGNPVILRIKPVSSTCYVRFDRFNLKEGWLEFTDIREKRTSFERSIRYNETSLAWEITPDNGASWSIIGGGSTGSSTGARSYVSITDPVYSVLSTDIVGKVPIMSNSGSTNNIELQLPPGESNAMMDVFVDAEYYLKVSTQNNEMIKYLGKSTVANGFVRSNKPGTSFSLVWTGTYWAVTNLLNGSSLKVDE